MVLLLFHHSGLFFYDMQRIDIPRESGVQSHSDLDGVVSIPAISNARNVPFLLCHEQFNEASLLAKDRPFFSCSYDFI